jgi:uncharacterized protein involved in exopolysaccharide biosynthesis/Mrp family chromosome partitioning ATPase
MNAYQQSATPVSDSIDIAEVIRGVWRRKKLVVALGLIAFVVSLFVVVTASREYTSEAKVLIENLETPFDRIQPGEANVRQAFDETDIQSQVSVLSSRDLGMRVISSLRLTEVPEFDNLRNGIGAIKAWLIRFGFKDDPRRQTAEQRAYNHYEKNLTVFAIPTSKVITVRYTAGDPKTAADVANALAETYVLSTREAQSEPTGRAREWLGEQIENLRKKVAESEAAAEEYRAKAGLLKGTQATLGTQELSELNTQIILAEAARTEAQAKANSIRDMLSRSGSVDASNDVLNSPLIQQLREQETQVIRQISELSVTYLPNHPKMIAAQNQLANLDRHMRRIALTIVEGLEEQAKVAATREAALRANLNSLKTKASVTGLDEVKLRALEREAAANREVLEALLNRYTDASAREGLVSQPGIARIIERADVPASPSYPKSGPMVIVSTLAGLVLGLGFAFLREVMSAASRIGRPHAMPIPASVPAPFVDAALQPQHSQARSQPPAAEPAFQPRPDPVMAQARPAPVAAPPPAPYEIPHSSDPKAAAQLAGEVLSSPSCVAAQSVGRLSAWIDQHRQLATVNRLAIVATQPNSLDAAVVTAAIARVRAMRGERVIAVDAAHGTASLEAAFSVGREAGFADLLTGQARFSDVIIKDTSSDAHLLPAGARRSVALNHLVSDRVQAIFQELGDVYDLVLVHAGSLTGISESVVRRCHGVLLLAPAEAASEAAATLAAWQKAGLKAAQLVRVANLPARGDPLNPVPSLNA